MNRLFNGRGLYLNVVPEVSRRLQGKGMVESYKWRKCGEFVCVCSIQLALSRLHETSTVLLDQVHNTPQHGGVTDCCAEIQKVHHVFRVLGSMTGS